CGRNRYDRQGRAAGEQPWRRIANRGTFMTWQPELDELRRRQALARAMGGPEKLKRHRDNGKLDVRERIDALVDEGSFHKIGELSGFAAYDPAGNLEQFTPANFIFGR